MTEIIRIKTGLTAIAVTALLMILAINWLANEHILKLNHSGADVDQLEITLLNLRRDEKDFMLRKDNKYQQAFTEDFNSFQDQLASLNSELDELDINIPELRQLPDIMTQYNKGMTDLVQAYTTLGLTPSEGLLALIIISWFISHSIQQRIENLSALMANIAYSNDLSYRADEDCNDKQSIMAGNFNKLLTSVGQLVSNVQSAIAELGSASNQLQSRSTESEQAISEQQVQTDSVATAITEMGVTIREIATNTESAATNADNSHNSAMTGLSEVSATKERIQHLSDNLSKTSEEITSLANLSESIGSVLDVIKAIAEQTEQVVVHIGRCHEQGEISVTQADSAELKINQIMADMQLIMDTSTQIAAAVEQQTQVSDEIGHNVTSIRDLTHQNSAVVHENVQAANAVAGQASSLADAIAMYKV